MEDLNVWEKLRDAQDNMLRPDWSNPKMTRPEMIVTHAEDFDEISEAVELLGWNALGTKVKMWPADLDPPAQKGKLIMIYDREDIPDGIDPV